MASDFAALAEQIVEDLLASSPVRASYAGDHRFDAELPDHGDHAIRSRVARLRRRSDELAEVDTETLSAQDDVDRQLLAAELDAQLFADTELDERTWNPLVHNPGELFFALLAREFAPPADRLAALAGRLGALPDALATAERVLGDCPRVHVETALGQLDGTQALVRDEVPRLLAREPGLAGRVDRPREEALAALDRHRGFLQALLDRADGDPRLGRRRYEAKLWHTLDSELTATAIRQQAETDLPRVREEMAEAAARLGGGGDVRAALDRLAADRPDNATILARAQQALTEATAFVGERRLLTLPGDPLEVIEMPEFARGVAVAYCDPPGPLETRPVPTFFAISPTPADWPPQRVESFYREYNHHMLANLTVHEAMPGHYVQLAHARRFRGSSRVRAVCESGSFIEGWAVYAEEVMVEHGFGGPAVRLQQLKMQLRMIINALLDQGVHRDGLSERDAMELMTGQGYQEEGEAAGKWRRALLTSAQLSTYYVGYREVSAIGRARPPEVEPAQWHDRMLAHGCPSPRHLHRLLLGG